ncbi:hypothetical protein BS50DRAFT_570925 [Corynespora cassiicola Philippines]|uniref:Uncharacterized protein n=1 Tax=Corynespora cassiicola Philippines TaxID=1448308 RepID=A0A2T2P2N1_CORCC|nr:hypothetical protein BS50DRAFT_570925 [Corynespora cassiicola Philippines]
MPPSHFFLKLQERRHAPQPGPAASPDPEVVVNDQGDDEWYDTASSEGNSPVKHSSMADGESSVVSVKPLSPDEEARLLPFVPSLFAKDLPPCGPEIQVAYENVNGRLRELWLFHRGRLTAVEVTQAVKEELNNQNFMYPAHTLKGEVKLRKPWRRESVFQYEMRWIEYFVRDAQAQDPALMTESEILDRKKESLIPAVLGLTTKHPAVLTMWEGWHEKKRAKTPDMHLLGNGKNSNGSGLQFGNWNGHFKKANGSLQDSGTESIDSDMTMIQHDTETGDLQTKDGVKAPAGTQV